MATVTIPSGETLWYNRVGEGPPLLQIHGSAFGHRNFETMTPLMAERLQVIEMDLPGYGESTGLPASTMEGIADQVFGLITAAGLGKVSVHGTSFGAMIALALAARHPEVVDRLILSCFLCRYDQAAREMRRTWKQASRDSTMAEVADLTAVAGFARSFYERPDAQAQLQAMRDAFMKNRPEAFRAGTETIERTDLSAYPAQVPHPTLLLAGAEDNMTPYKPAASGVGFHQIVGQMRDARLVVLDECGHYLVIEQPQAAADAIFDFMDV